MTTPLGQAPTGPFASQGLQELQAHSNQVGGLFGNQGTGVNPLGAVEPFNQFQQNALSSLGGGLSGLQNELPGYQNLYNENILNPQLAEIDRQLGMGNNRLLGRKAGSGNLGVLGSSAIGTQLSELQDSANRLKLNARKHAFQGGLGLRNQTLQDMLRAGGTIQNQNQNTLGAIYPQIQQTLPQNRLAQLGQGLSGFPGSSTTTGTSMGATPGQPGLLSNILGIGKTALGLGQGLGIFGGGGGGAPSFGNQFAGGGGSNWSFGAPPATGGYNLGGSYIRPY